MTNQITTHRAAALARLAQRYKGKPKLEALLGAFVNRTQGIEDALWQLRTERFIVTAVGVQLDVIGKIVGQPRGNSADDAAYRLRLLARMRANGSSGTVEDIYAVFYALGEVAEDLRLEPFFPAALVLHLEDEPLLDSDALLYAEFLEAARAGAIDAQLHYSASDAANTFTLPYETALSANYSETGGVYPTSMPVGSTAGFPESGFLLARYTEDEGAEQIRFAYTSKTPTTFEGVVYAEGAVEDLLSGEMILAPPGPYSELSGNFADPFPSSMPVKDTSAFPASGVVTLAYGAITARIFAYTSKTPTTLEGVTTLLGTHTTYIADMMVVCNFQTLSTYDEEIEIGGHLSDILGA